MNIITLFNVAFALVHAHPIKESYKPPKSLESKVLTRKEWSVSLKAKKSEFSVKVKYRFK